MSKQYRILLVDDQPEVLKSLRRTLMREDLQILTCSSAVEGLEILDQEGIDLVISDNDMPAISGIDFLQRVRLRHPRVQRVLLTGRADLRLAMRALNEGAAHRFLQKPWDRIDLRGLVDILLHTTPHCAPSHAA